MKVLKILKKFVLSILLFFVLFLEGSGIIAIGVILSVCALFENLIRRIQATFRKQKKQFILFIEDDEEFGFFATEGERPYVVEKENPKTT